MGASAEPIVIYCKGKQTDSGMELYACKLFFNFIAFY